MSIVFPNGDILLLFISAASVMLGRRFDFFLPSINVCVFQSTMLIMFVNADAKADVLISSFHTVSILALAFMPMLMPTF